MYFWYYLQFFQFDLEKFISKKLEICIFLPEVCTFGAKKLLNIVVR